MDPERDEVAGGGTPEEELRRAIDLACKALASRDRTEAELRAVLERGRTEPGAIGAAIDELRAAGCLDDARYAQRFAEDKRSIERWGRERIERDLVRRGVPAELAAAAAAHRDTDDERAAAVQLLTERFRAGLGDDRERDRAWRLLVRRGYAPELAYEAVRSHERGGTSSGRTA